MGLWPFGGGKQKAEPKEEPVKCDALSVALLSECRAIVCAAQGPELWISVCRREAPQAVISAPQPSAKADGNEPEDMKSAADAAADLPLPAVFEFGGYEACCSQQWDAWRCLLMTVEEFCADKSRAAS
jgi:hypothetical protein